MINEFRYTFMLAPIRFFNGIQKFSNQMNNSDFLSVSKKSKNVKISKV